MMVRTLIGFVLGVASSYGATELLAEVSLTINWQQLTDTALSVPW